MNVTRTVSVLELVEVLAVIVGAAVNFAALPILRELRDRATGALRMACEARLRNASVRIATSFGLLTVAGLAMLAEPARGGAFARVAFFVVCVATGAFYASDARADVRDIRAYLLDPFVQERYIVKGRG